MAMDPQWTHDYGESWPKLLEQLKVLAKTGDPGGDRTRDPLIKSQKSCIWVKSAEVEGAVVMANVALINWRFVCSSDIEGFLAVSSSVDP